jgi:preprotein translocase subunit SecE
MFQKITKFFKDVQTEMAKVSWPSREALKEQTMVVVITTLLFSVFIFIIDRIISFVINAIY